MVHSKPSFNPTFGEKTPKDTATKRREATCSTTVQNFTPICGTVVQKGWKYSDGDLANGGIECNGGMKKSRISTNISLYLGTDAR